MLENFSFASFIWWILVLIYVPVCIGLIAVVLLQKGKGVGFAGAFGAGGGSDTVFGPRSSRSLPQKLTYGAAAAFMLIALMLSLLSGRVGRGSAPELLEEVPTAGASMDALFDDAATPVEGDGLTTTAPSEITVEMAPENVSVTTEEAPATDAAPAEEAAATDAAPADEAAATDAAPAEEAAATDAAPADEAAATDAAPAEDAAATDVAPAEEAPVAEVAPAEAPAEATAAEEAAPAEEAASAEEAPAADAAATDAQQ